MSVAEIKEKLKEMTPEERKEIQQTLTELSREQAAPRVREIGPDDAEFKAAADHVFTHYHDLLRRLSK